jgi:hypothetical protein
MSKTRQADGSRFAASLTATSSAIESAREAVANAAFAWGLWADSVRQDAELREGGELAWLGDPAVLEDPEYSHALDLGSAINEIKGELDTLIERWSHIDPETDRPTNQAADYADRHPVLCAHAGDDGRGAHWLRPGEKCAGAEPDREAG